MNRNKITIGLFGFGCVGYGLYEALEKTPGIRAEISRICVKDKNKHRPLPLHHFTFDPDDILDDPAINTVVELIDDADAAFSIVSRALKNGKAVVTANKKMIAEHFEELLQLQKKFNVPLLYEAACCASIPIIRNLEEYYDNDLLESIEGIVNGSTNYILSKTVEENISYPEALKEAQDKGFAESNPVLDTGGFDAKYKLQILIAHAFGRITRPDDIFNLGIDRISNLAFTYAREKGLKIKLVAFAEKLKSGGIRSFVLPKFVGRTDKLFNVDGVFNGVKTKSFFSDEQFFSGKGAGAYPTASAVLSDISALSYNYRYEYKKLNAAEILQADSEILLKIFLSHAENELDCKDYFDQVLETYSGEGTGYTIGIVSLASLKVLLATCPDVSTILVEVIPAQVVESPKAVNAHNRRQELVF